MHIKELTTYLDDLLDLKNFGKDSSNNGLQVEAADDIKKIGFSVDACQQLFDQAAAEGCDMVFVHHGLSWGSNLKRITGLNAKRIGSLFRNNLSLYAAHLPLDAHPELGHNVVMAKDLGLKEILPFAEYAGTEIGYFGEFETPVTLAQLVDMVNETVGTECKCVAPIEPAEIKSVGIVSGGGADCMTDAYELGIDAFLTGEYVHQHYHTCMEYGIPLIAGGHYRTECPGVRAVMNVIERELNLETVFFDIPTGL